MVSARMQGGCTCENASMLRVGTGNVEIAALIAPRPFGMTAADDWTKTMPTDGFPELKKVYEMFGAKDRVQLFPALHFRAQLQPCRSCCPCMVSSTVRLCLGLKEPILERDSWSRPASNSRFGMLRTLHLQAARPLKLKIERLGERTQLSKSRRILKSHPLAEKYCGLRRWMLTKQLVVIINEKGDKGKSSFRIPTVNLCDGKWNGPLSKLSIHSLSVDQQLVEPARGELSIAVGDAYGYSSNEEQPLVKIPGQLQLIPLATIHPQSFEG